MQTELDLINAELQVAAHAPATLPAEVAVHPFQRVRLGMAPFACVDCTIGTARCAYCTTPLKYLYHIQDAHGRAFVVGSECVKQTGGAVAGFEKFNRQMMARIRELQAKARREKAAGKAAEAATAWKEANAVEWAYMQKRAERGSGYYKYLLDCVEKYGNVFTSKLESVQRDMREDAARVAKASQVAPAAAPAPVVSIEAIETAFARAKAAGIMYPKLRLGGFVFSPASERASVLNMGAVYVKERVPSGGLPGKYLGKVLGGKFLKVRECDTAQEAEIVSVCTDPKAAAVAYGKAFGKCSVCNRDLTDAASVEAGIGPVCATKYGF